MMILLPESTLNQKKSILPDSISLPNPSRMIIIPIYILHLGAPSQMTTAHPMLCSHECSRHKGGCARRVGALLILEDRIPPKA